jgi:hypothetical protein
MMVLRRKQAFLAALQSCWLSLVICVVSPAWAGEKDSNVVEQTSSKMVALFCANEGKVARCVGQQARDCEEIVKPFIDSCLQKVKTGAARPDAALFENCFWDGFTKKYGKSFDYSEECFHSDNKDNNPLQEVPPELAKDMKPLNSER